MVPGPRHARACSLSPAGIGILAPAFQQGVSVPQDLRIALIGCGRQAPKHLSGLSTVPGVEVVLSDLHMEHAQELGREQNLPWATIDEVMADDTVDAVDICSPVASHAGLVRRAVEAGKDFFCEKPLCPELAEARELEALVREHARIGMVGYIYRYAPAFITGKRMMPDCRQGEVSRESPVLGPVLNASFRLGGAGNHKLWKHRRAEGGGAINEMLVHMVDLALWYFGEVESAELLVDECMLPRRRFGDTEYDVDAEDFVLVRLRMASGVDVLCQADLMSPAFTQRMEIQGENATLMGSIQPDMPSFVYCKEGRGGYEAGTTPLDAGPVNLYETQMNLFAHAVRERDTTDLCTVEDSVRLLEVLEQIRSKRSL